MELAKSGATMKCTLESFGMTWKNSRRNMNGKWHNLRKTSWLAMTEWTPTKWL